LSFVTFDRQAISPDTAAIVPGPFAAVRENCPRFIVLTLRPRSGPVCYDALGRAAAAAARESRGKTMRSHRFFGATVLGVLGATALVIPATAHARREPPIPFDDARLEIEFNATNGDAGFQVFADAEEWKEFEIFRPDGRRIVDFEVKGNLRDFGLTELFSESSEPPFTELPFEEFKELFPEGDYRFEGETIDGLRMASDVPFSHTVLDPPQFVQPQDGGTLPADAAVIQWAPVAGAASYEVIVTREDPLRVMDIRLAPEDTSLTVPPEFLDPGVEYKIEVHAADVSGNRTFTEVGFTVG
jgi:hypothetical protein